MMARIIGRDRSIIPACDVDVSRFEDIVRETASISEIGGYKISAVLALSVGIPRVVEVARKYTSKPLIYDHQKAATDIPDTGAAFASMLKDCGIDALILFPLAGPATETAWIQSAQEVGLPIIVGGHMTHERFLASEGGFVTDAAIDRIFTIAASHQVSDYVVPGNKPAAIEHIRTLLSGNSVSPTFYAPGFIAQGGRISDAAAAAGPRWHAIVGRAIYDARDIGAAARDLATAL